MKKKNQIIINKEISNLIKKRNELKNINSDINNEKINLINKRISDIEAEENRSKILKNFKYFSDNPEKINMSEMWKILKKIWPNMVPYKQQRETTRGKLFLIQKS